MKFFSLSDLFEKDFRLFENKVFKMLEINQTDDMADEDRLDDMHKFKKFTYVQIKRSKFKSRLKGHQTIQIIDISVNISYDVAIVERNLLNMINAMVSHELRNPLNSIMN